MWTDNNNFLINNFKDIIIECFEAAIEFAAEMKSRKLSFPEILWSLLAAKPGEGRYKRLAKESNEELADIISILVKNKEATSKKDAAEAVRYLIFSSSSKSETNYFNTLNWDKILVNTFAKLCKTVQAKSEFIPGVYLEKIKDIGLKHLLLGLFYEIRSNKENSVFDIFNVEAIIAALEAYIISNVPRTVFDSDGSLRKDLFNENAINIINSALKTAGEMGYKKMLPQHLFLSFLEDQEGFGALAILPNLPLKESMKSIQEKLTGMLRHGPLHEGAKLFNNQDSYSSQAKEIVQKAVETAVKKGLTRAGAKELLLSLIRNGGDIFRPQLANIFKIDLKRLVEKAEEIKEGQKLEINLPYNLGVCYNISVEPATESTRPQIYGRDKESNDLIKIFHRKFKRNIILHGEKGIGKTSMVYALANQILKGNYDIFKGYPVIYIDLSEITDEELNSKVPRLISFMEENHKRIYIIDGFNTFIKFRKDVCSKYFKQNKYFLMGIMSTDDYREMMKSEQLLDDYFEFYELEEPSIELTKKIVYETAKDIRKEYQVEFNEKLIDSTIKMAGDFLIAERFPQKAIRLLRLACNEVFYDKALTAHTTSLPEVTKQYIAKQVSNITKLPEDLILGDGEDKDYYGILSSVVIGQERAIEKVADRLDLIQKGLVDKSKPPAIFLFVGLTGTGKTELAKEIAKVYSKSRKLITYAMENFKDKHNVSGLIGTSAGYVGFDEGGKIVNDLNKDPYSVVLFDEVEKAHPDIWDPFLHLFDEGIISDLSGKSAYGNKAFFILTSNIGYKKICQMLRDCRPIEEIEEEILEELYNVKHESTGLNCFRPEFVGRILRRGGLVVFNPLSLEATEKITQKNVRKFCDEEKAAHDIDIEIEEDVIRYIAEKCFYENEKYLRKIYDIFSSNLNEVVPYKGGRIIDFMVDSLIKHKVAKNIKQLKDMGMAKFVLSEMEVKIEIPSDHEEIEKKRLTIRQQLVEEIDSMIAELGATEAINPDGIDIRQLEKASSQLKEVVALLKQDKQDQSIGGSL